MRRQTIAFLLALVAAASVAGTAPVAARSQALYGTLTGIVTDAQGLRVEGASVVITHAANGLKRDATTNNQGEFDIVNVQPGTFHVRVSKGNLSAERKGIVVGAGEVVRLNTKFSTREVTVEPSATDTLQVRVVLSTSKGGRMDGSAAVGEADAFTSYITADHGLCALSAGREPRVDPAIGWRLSGQVLSRSDQEMNVRIEWQRVWDGGVRQMKPRSGTLEAPIRIGERFLLDSVVSPAISGCGVTSGRLEVIVVSRPLRNYQALVTTDGGTGSPPAAVAGMGARGGGFGGGRVGGAGAGSAPGDNPSRRSGSGSFGGGGGGSAMSRQALLEEAAAKLRETAAADGPLFETELWLVHTLPDKTERPELIRQPLRQSASFVFPSVRLVSRGSTIDVEVFGFVRRVAGDGGAPSLQVAVGQRHVGTGSSDNYSGSGKVVSWPSPTEVLSFELPSDNRLPPGHRFDLRLRLTPR